MEPSSPDLTALPISPQDRARRYWLIECGHTKGGPIRCWLIEGIPRAGLSGVGSSDAGASDTSSSDAGASDTGSSNAGIPGAGLSGVGSSNADASDAGASDTDSLGAQAAEVSGQNTALTRRGLRVVFGMRQIDLTV